MFAHHPAFAIPPESKYLTKFAKSINEFGDLRDVANRRALILSIEQYMRNAWLDKNHREWMPGLADAVDEVAENADPTFAGVLDAMYRFFAASKGATRWGDKQATFQRCMPTILQLFPNARIIHIIRDGRSLASSILPMSFGPNTIYVAAKRWRGFVEHGLDFASKNPRNVYTVRYEDLIDNPEKYLREICEFIEDEFYPEMLNFHQKGNEVVPRKAIHGQLNKPVNKDRVARWKTDLSASQVRVFEAVAGSVLDKLDYEIVNKNASLNPIDRLWGNWGNKILWWKPFSHPVGLWDRLRMSVLRKKLRRY